jgi:MFS family permease
MSTTRAGARTGGVLAATCLSTLVVNAKTSAVSILLPTISEDTGTSVETRQVVGHRGLAGRCSGDHHFRVAGGVFGRNPIFQLSAVLFVASCVLIALLTTGGMAIAGRVIQGAASWTILACGLSLLSVAHSGHAQLRVVSLWGPTASAARHG